jgi:hypothetical protein
VTQSADRPPGVELRETRESVIARHHPTGVVCHGETVESAIRWLAEGVALELGCDVDVDQPERFLAAVDAIRC